MTGRATMLPVAMVVVIAFLTLVAIFSGRSDAPNVEGDRDYPFHICTFNDLCVGNECTRDPDSFVVYLEHEDGNPRIELDGVNPSATMTETADGLEFETTGGEVRGTLSIFGNRSLNWVGFSGEGSDLVEHYGSGSCERLKTP